jgi:GT2 family glycosyltransferase
MPTVSVIIVAYKRADLLQKCLASLAKQIARDFDFFIVDNGKQNVGFAAGANIGIRKTNGRLVALLNDDVELDRLWTAKMLLAASKNPKAGMFASRVLRPDGSQESAGCYVYPDGNGMCIRDGRAPDFPSGCAAIYRRSMLNEIGLFDERFFCYNEDTELGIRAAKAGWSCVYVPGAIAHHHGSASTSRHSRKKLYWVERNRLRIMAKHFTWQQIVGSVPWTVRRYLKGGR